METTVVEDRSAIDRATFAFVEDLAAALNGREPIDIPSFPNIAMRVKKVLEDQNSSSEKIGRVVGSEPGLASRLLKMANSAALNTSGRQVLDIKTAINRLGHDQIRSSAMSFAMKNLMDSRTVTELKPFLTELWNHSIQVAAIAYALGQRTAGVKPDEAMFVGLVHDIGKLYILTRIESYPDLCSCSDTMDHIMNDWHTSIGKSILENWDFPEHVQHAIEQHEDQNRQIYADPDLTDVIIVANLFANHSDSNNCLLDFASVASCQRMGIDVPEFQEIMVESQKEINELENALRG
ncbi:MAG: HDOD domain-containing protein [Gammaproteobacteria bacterium]|nr:HDOD domain-containing protein [Gammaproteobacteria bacterium]